MVREDTKDRGPDDAGADCEPHHQARSYAQVPREKFLSHDKSDSEPATSENPELYYSPSQTIVNRESKQLPCDLREA